MSNRRWIKCSYPAADRITTTCAHCGLNFTYDKTFKPRKYHRECAHEVRLKQMREKNAEYRRLHRIRLGAQKCI